MVSNNPSSRRLTMKINPITSAVPSAWTVSANGQPHIDSPRTQTENCELSSHASTARSSLVCYVRQVRTKCEPGLPAAWANGLVELVQCEEGNAEHTCIDRNDRQKHLKHLKPVHRGHPSRSKIVQQSAPNDHPGPSQQHRGGNPLRSHRCILSWLEVPKPVGRREIQ